MAKIKKPIKLIESERVLIFFGIVTSLALAITFVLMIKNIIVEGKTFEVQTKTVEQLSDDIDHLTMQKTSISKEIEELTSSKDELEQEVISLNNNTGIDKYVPEGAGTPKSYMCYSQDWIEGSEQYNLHMYVIDDMYYDDLGYARLGDRYFVAVKPYYGEVGDLLEITQADDTVISCIVGDNKGFENDDIYTHYDGTIVEFMVQNLSFRGVEETHPEFYQPIKAIKNMGSYYDQN